VNENSATMSTKTSPQTLTAGEIIQLLLNPELLAVTTSQPLMSILPSQFDHNSGSPTAGLATAPAIVPLADAPPQTNTFNILEGVVMAIPSSSDLGPPHGQGTKGPECTTCPPGDKKHAQGLVRDSVE
jgi:hypothetical protein